MEEKQISAVEWLFDNLDLSGGSEAFKTLEQAKEMEKEQIIDAHLTGLIYPLTMEATKQATEYYNKTYGSK
jgi:hypothetical protein